MMSPSIMDKGTNMEDLEPFKEDPSLKQSVSNKHLDFLKPTVQYFDVFKGLGKDVTGHGKPKYSLIKDVEDYQPGIYDKPLHCFGCGVGFLLGFMLHFYMWEVTIVKIQENGQVLLLLLLHLCNTKATSQQALLIHADGIRAKFRAHTAKQQPSDEAVPKSNDSLENNDNTGAPDDKNIADKENPSSNGAAGKDHSFAENRNISSKKRKLDNNDDGSTDKCLNGLGNGVDTQAVAQEIPANLKKTKYESELKGAKSKKINQEKEKGLNKMELPLKKHQMEVGR